MRYYTRFLLLLASITTAVSAHAISTPSCFTVNYGEQGVEGRVYDSATDTTTFTYTVSGKQASGCGILKYFFLEVSSCSAVNLVSTSPSYSTYPANWSAEWKRPMPDLFLNFSNPSGKDPIFGKYGIRWYGWHNNGTPPPLLNAGTSGVFTMKFRGNIPEGNIQGNLRHYTNGTWVDEAFIPVPGPNCAATCTGETKISFNQLSSGETISNQFSSSGITFAATSSSQQPIPGPIVFNNAAPGTATADGSPNITFGGTGQPAHNFLTGAGVGNYLSLNKSAVVPVSGKPGPGMIALTFTNPGKFCSAKFLNVSQAGGSISVYSVNGTKLLTKAIPAKGVNSLQTVNICDANIAPAKSVILDLIGEVAVDDVTVCVPPTPTTTTTTVPPTTTTAPPTTTTTSRPPTTTTSTTTTTTVPPTTTTTTRPPTTTTSTTTTTTPPTTTTTRPPTTTTTTIATTTSTSTSTSTTTTNPPTTTSTSTTTTRTTTTIPATTTTSTTRTTTTTSTTVPPSSTTTTIPVTTTVPPTTTTTTFPGTTTVPPTTTTTTIPGATTVPPSTTTTTVPPVTTTTTVPETTTTTDPGTTTTTVTSSTTTTSMPDIKITDPKTPDCAGVPNGTAVIDCCGVCGGDGTSCPELCKYYNLKSQKRNATNSIKYLLKAVKKYSNDAIRCGGDVAKNRNRIKDATTLASSALSTLTTQIADKMKVCDTPFCAKTSLVNHLGLVKRNTQALYKHSRNSQISAGKACGSPVGPTTGGKRRGPDSRSSLSNANRNLGKIPNLRCNN